MTNAIYDTIICDTIKDKFYEEKIHTFRVYFSGEFWKMKKIFILFLVTWFILLSVNFNFVRAQSGTSFSGIYPNLAVFGDTFNEIPNNVNEAGIGAMAFWTGKVWAVTYSPHRWLGAKNYLYEIDPDTMTSVIRSESVGVLFGETALDGTIGMTRGGTY